MSYRAPLPDYQFFFDHVVGLEHVFAQERFADAMPDLISAILSEADRLCEDVAASCLSLQLVPLMSQGQIEALEHHSE